MILFLTSGNSPTAFQNATYIPAWEIIVMMLGK